MSTGPDDFKWIGKFLSRYIATIGPHDWPDDPDDMRYFAEGWVGAFRMARITEAEADAARVRLAGYPPAFKREHLPAVVEVVLKMRERDATQRLVEQIGTPPEQASAEAVSCSCPECGGNGLARRKGVWVDRSWSATASLYCRCPMGRYRMERDEFGSDSLPFDDLQALPALWNPDLSHSSWSARPAAPPSVEGRQWRYLQPGETPPPPIASKAARSTAMPAKAPRLPWFEKVPADLPMPKPVPRLAPEPEAPPPCPKAEAMTEEELKWL